MSTKTFSNKIYIYKFLDDLVLIYPFYSVYMASKGLSVLQISSLLIFWSAVSMLTNIPTGVLADRYSRRKLLALAQVFKALGLIPWFFYPKYLGFVLGFVLWGLGGSLKNGTFEALVYDGLKQNKQEKDYVKIIGRAYSISLIGTVTASILAGATITFGYGFIFTASVIVILLSSVVVLKLPEFQSFKKDSQDSYFSMVKTGIKEVLQRKNILITILLIGFIYAIYGSLEEYIPLLVQGTGVSLSLVAWVVGATIVFASLGSFIAHRFEKLSASKLLLLLILTGVLLVITGLLKTKGAIAPLLGYVFVINLLKRIYDGKLQYSLESQLRATITSVASFTIELLTITAYVIYGSIANLFDSFTAFAVFGVGVVGVGLLYLTMNSGLMSRAENK